MFAKNIRKKCIFFVTHGNILHVTHGNKGMLQMVTLINSIQYRYLVNIYNIGSHILIQGHKILQSKILCFLFQYFRESKIRRKIINSKKSGAE